MLTLNKSQRIKSKIVTRELFSNGQKISAFPLLVYAIRSDKQQVMVTVSKRSFRNAVDRNRIKRKLRESFRLQQTVIGNYQLAIIFTGKSLKHLDGVNDSLGKIITKLQDDQEDNS